MRPADLEDALQSTPFIPFDVCVDGKTIPAGHSEQVLLNKSKTVAVIVPDDHIHIVNVGIHRRAHSAPQETQRSWI